MGAGPGGLFAALKLIELGLRPIVVERGKNVRERKEDLARISREHKVNAESNYSFGEGGAGAYSDGKLYTRSKKRGSVEKILNVFCQHGASPTICRTLIRTLERTSFPESSKTCATPFLPVEEKYTPDSNGSYTHRRSKGKRH